MLVKSLMGNGKVQIMQGSMDYFMGSDDGGLSWVEISRKDVEVVNGEFIIRFAPVVKETPTDNLTYEDMCDISRQASNLVFTEPVECTGGTLLPSVKPVGDYYESNVFYKKENEENNKE